MVELAGSLYLLSTAAFSLLALVVGARLLLLWHRSRQLAECLLGLGLIFTACLGYGVMMIGIIGRSMADDPANAPAIFRQLTTVGWLFHNAGVVLMLGFVVRVFRSGVAWARGLAISASAVLWAGLLGYYNQGGMSQGVPTGWYWVMFCVIGTYPLWTTFESFHYYTRMRKRASIGLAEPLVTNRFLLWGLASISATASIWIVNAPALMSLTPGTEEMARVSAISMLLTSFFGMATIAIYWLTFFPPRWYRARLEPAANS